MKKQFTLALCTLLFFSNIVQSQVQPFLTRQHLDTKIIATAMPYRLCKPLGYESSRTYPLVLFLHGAGERGTDNNNQLTANKGATLWAETANQQKYPCFVVAPQCATNKQWVNTPWGNGSYNQNAIPISDQLALALSIVDSLCREFKIDASKLYIVGLSMGGYGTWDAITRFPSKFAAAIPICGAGDPTKANLISTLPIRCFHSSDDPIVPVKGTRDMVKAINALGPNNRTDFYTEYTNKGHGSWEAAFADPTLVDWLFSPKTVVIEPMANCNITTLGGSSTAQYVDSSTGEGKDMLFDNLSNTKFLTFHNASWLQFVTKNNIPYKLTRYSITSGNDAPERDPVQLILKGSNDGVNWEKIDSVNNIVFTSRAQTIEYNIQPLLAFKRFRVDLKTASSTILQLAELRLFGAIENTAAVVNPATGFQELFYPNPAKTQLQLALNSEEKKSCIIQDTNGRIVKQQQVSRSNAVVNIDTLKDGTYLLTLNGKNESVSAKLIKK